MSKHKNLNECKTWKELSECAEDNGIKYLYTHGGHAFYGNEKGKMPFSTHEKEPSKHLRGQVIRQIKALSKVVIACIAIAYVALQFI